MEDSAPQQRQRDWFRHASRAEDRLAIALDVSSADEAVALAKFLRGRCSWVKVGMELFYAAGGDLIRRLQDMEFRVFLDLKLHDIPNTVAAAIRSLERWNVQLLTLHLSGGEAMLRSAVAATQAMRDAALLVGVTVLTSMDEASLNATGIVGSPSGQVQRLARLGLTAGLDGLVSSSLELTSLRQEFGEKPVLVVPGIRPAGSAVDDQSRTATPKQAIEAGASLLVVGRPVTRATEPERAVEAILTEIASGLHL